MKRFLTYCCLLALATLLSCTREEVPAPLCGPGSTLELHFSTVGLQSTKATTPGDGDPADGGGIAGTTDNPDLVILIANNITGDANYGNIVMAYPTTGSLEGGFTANDTDATIKFDFSEKPAGEYIVYAFGNTAGLWDMTTDGSDSYSGATLTTLTTAAQVEALKFKTSVVTSEGVALKNGRLPVSAKTTLTVSDEGKNGDAYLELLRCVAKVTAIIKNNTLEEIDLYNYTHTVHGMNPNAGWVIPHENDTPGTAGNLVADPCTKYSDPDYVIPISSDSSIPYNWYVFPSNGPYTIDIQFTLNKGNSEPEDPSDPPAEKTYTSTNLPVTNWRAVNIPALARNQHITVTTRISKGLTVSFNFEISDWTTHTASVEFL